MLYSGYLEIASAIYHRGNSPKNQQWGANLILEGTDAYDWIWKFYL